MGQQSTQLSSSVPHPMNHMASGAVDPWVCHMERLEFSVPPPYPQGLWCPTQLTTLALGPLILRSATLRGLSSVSTPLTTWALVLLVLGSDSQRGSSLVSSLLPTWALVPLILGSAMQRVSSSVFHPLEWALAPLILGSATWSVSSSVSHPLTHRGSGVPPN